jgi:hypothetical protein
MIRATAMANSTRRATNDNARGVHQAMRALCAALGHAATVGPLVIPTATTTTLITCAPTQGHITAATPANEASSLRARRTSRWVRGRTRSPARSSSARACALEEPKRPTTSIPRCPDRGRWPRGRDREVTHRAAALDRSPPRQGTTVGRSRALLVDSPIRRASLHSRRPTRTLPALGTPCRKNSMRCSGKTTAHTP